MLKRNVETKHVPNGFAHGHLSGCALRSLRISVGLFDRPIQSAVTVRPFLRPLQLERFVEQQLSVNGFDSKLDKVLHVATRHVYPRRMLCDP
jgi:hypothetical protein